MSKKIEFKPRKYGKLTAIKEIGKKYVHGRHRIIWLFKCECSKIIELPKDKVIYRNNPSCGCYNGSRNSDPKFHSNWQGYKEISKSYFLSTQTRAKNKNIEFSLKIEDFWNKLEEQNFKCSISNLDIKPPTKKLKSCLEQGSLDRIDSNQGYTYDNIQWLSSTINLMKLDIDQEIFINKCIQITNFIDNDISIEIKNNCQYPRIFGNLSKKWKGYGDISAEFWHNIKKGAKRRNINFNLSTKDMWKQFLKQNKKCRFTGINLIMPNRFNINESNIASLDRIDSKKGYIIGNIQWIEKSINTMKWSLQDNDFINICRIISNYNE